MQPGHVQPERGDRLRGAGEVSQIAAAMRACKELAGPQRLLLVGDSKLVSYANLADMIGASVEFIASASKTYVRAGELAALDRATATEVDYLAERDTDTPASARGSWAVCKDTMIVTGRRKRDPVLHLRRVCVHSSARGAAAATGPRRRVRPGRPTRPGWVYRCRGRCAGRRRPGGRGRSR